MVPDVLIRPSKHRLKGRIVFKDLAPAVQLIYNLRFTPTTLVISPVGKIVKSWNTDVRAEDILAFLDLYSRNQAKS